MTDVSTSAQITYTGRDGNTRTGRVTATSSDGLVLVLPDGGCVELGCSRRPMVEQITQADVIVDGSTR
jgi:hypothetical protein